MISIAAFSDLVTLTRASEGTYWDAHGVLKTAAIDTPRFDHDPATGRALGLLVEGAATNSVLHSADLTQTAWTKPMTAEGVTLEATIGGVDLYRVTRTSDIANGARVQQFFPLTPGVYTASAFAMPGSDGLIHVWITSIGAAEVGGAGGANRSAFNPATGVFDVADPNLVATAQDMGAGVWRIGLTFEVTANPNNDPVYLQLVADAGNTPGAWGIFGLAQMEEGRGMTSPIITAASTVTRAQDDAILTTTALGIEQDATVLTIGRGPRTYTADGIVAIVGIGPFAERIILSVRDFAGNGILRPYFQNYVGEDTDFAGSALLPISGSQARLAMAWDAASVSAAHDGSIVWTATKTATRINPVDRIDIGAFAGGARKWGGQIERIVIWPSRLTDTQLQEITA